MTGPRAAAAGHANVHVSAGTGTLTRLARAGRTAEAGAEAGAQTGEGTGAKTRARPLRNTAETETEAGIGVLVLALTLAARRTAETMATAAATGVTQADAHGLDRVRGSR